MEKRICLTDRIACLVKLSEAYRTPTLLLVRETPYGTKKKLFVSPGQFTIMHEKVDQVYALSHCLQDNPTSGTGGEEPGLSIPIDEYKSLRVARFGARTTVTIRTSKHKIDQPGLAFGFELSEFTTWMNKRPEIIESLKQVKGTTESAYNTASMLYLHRWVMINKDTGSTTAGKRLYIQKGEAFDAGVIMAKKNPNIVVCVQESRFPMPSVEEVVFCAQIVQLTDHFERYKHLKPETPPGQLYDESRESLAPAATSFLVADLFNTMGAQNSYKGLNTMPTLSADNEAITKAIVIERGHNSLSDLQKTLVLDAFDLNFSDIPSWMDQ